MKSLLSLSVVAFLSMAVVGQAEEVKSGLQPGKFIGAFYVTKCAGAEEDGVAVGKNLCYRCKYGGRPQVMVFTRSSDEKVAKLVAGLDAAIKKHSDKELSGFVSLLGSDKDALSADAKKFAKTSQAKSVPVVVPNEFENGPENYGLNPKAEVTVILAGAGKVQANHAYASTKDLDVDAVLADIAKIVN
jgi:hypothetical protein